MTLFPYLKDFNYVRSLLDYYKIYFETKPFRSLINKTLYLLMQYDGKRVHESCYENFLIYFLAKYEKYLFF